MRPNSIFGGRFAESFILVGPVLEGFVGGLSTFNGVTHAYISDCTRHGSRSTIFSTVQGMVFVGLAIGPWFGGLFFPPKGYSDGHFFASITLITLTILYVLFVCPESRVPSPSESTSTSTTPLDKIKSALALSPLQIARRIPALLHSFMSALLLPISMFAPRRVPGTRRKNWNMTYVGLSLFLYIVSTVSAPPFHFHSSILRFLLCLLGCLSVFFLIFFLKSFNLAKNGDLGWDAGAIFVEVHTTLFVVSDRCWRPSIGQSTGYSVARIPIRVCCWD
jgi:hypothetical protein